MSLYGATVTLASIFMAAGVLCLFVSIKGSEWFFRSSGVRAVTWRMSRRNARLLYGIIGVAIMAMAVKMLTDLS